VSCAIQSCGTSVDLGNGAYTQDQGVGDVEDFYTVHSSLSVSGQIMFDSCLPIAETPLGTCTTYVVSVRNATDATRRG
jgi:hypothetical protein